MRIDQLPRSENVEDRRGSGGFRVPGGRGGGLGILGIILLTLLGWWFGIDPSVLIGGADIFTRGRQQQEQPQGVPGKTEASVPDEIKDRVSAILGSTEKVWSDIFQKSGR